MLSALLGTGLQLCLLTFFVILITIAGVLYEGRGAIMTVFIVCYSLTSFVSGYISGGFNSRNSGKSWIRAMALTATLFPGITFGIAFVLNTIAIAYHSLAAVPFGAPGFLFSHPLASAAEEQSGVEKTVEPSPVCVSRNSQPSLP